MPGSAFEPHRTYREALAAFVKLQGGHGFKATIRPIKGNCYCGTCKELRRSVSA